VTLSRAQVYASIHNGLVYSIPKHLQNSLLLFIFAPEQFEQRTDYRWAACGKTLY